MADQSHPEVDKPHSIEEVLPEEVKQDLDEAAEEAHDDDEDDKG